MSLATNVLLQGMNSNVAVSTQIRAEKSPLGVASGEGHWHLGKRRLSLVGPGDGGQEPRNEEQS